MNVHIYKLAKGRNVKEYPKVYQNMYGCQMTLNVYFYLPPANRSWTEDYKMPDVCLCMRPSCFTKSSLPHLLMKIYSPNFKIMFKPTETCLP